jgi:hypothetical protein
MRSVLRSAAIACSLCLFDADAQRVDVYPAPELAFPSETDSNSPAVWLDNELVLYNSTGLGPRRSSGQNLFRLNGVEPVVLGPSAHRPYWIEAAWVDDDGLVYAWYHHEPPGVCRGSGLTAPQIGALVSRDGGRSFIDLGIVLSNAYRPNCGARNGFFAGGNGDFTVIVGRQRRYIYFLFSNYGGPLSEQGVAVARMPFHARFNPVGAVNKYHAGDWFEPGLGGLVTPIFPATVDWSAEDTDSFWGPSVHWNSYLNKYVMLINRSCCAPGWVQEGVYVSFNSSLEQPGGWTQPVKILSDVHWYPQVLGLGPGGTDKLAGQTARLYVYGVSRWKLVFHKRPPRVAPEPQ